MATITEMFQAYGLQAAKTANPTAPNTYYRMGFLGELGELLNVYKKEQWHGKPHDRNKWIDELGDCLWYATMIVRGSRADTDGFCRLLTVWGSDVPQKETLNCIVDRLVGRMLYGSAGHADYEQVAWLTDALFHICHALDVSVSEVLVKNITKLQARYPNGFVPYDQRG
jgi:NTP pyrophosphatase (non-canonical NTP hydrolase)